MGRLPASGGTGLQPKPKIFETPPAFVLVLERIVCLAVPLGVLACGESVAVFWMAVLIWLKLEKIVSGQSGEIPDGTQVKAVK